MSLGERRVCFYKGVRLGVSFKHWKPIPTPGAEGVKQGASRLHGAINPRSPNFIWDIMVATSSAKPMTTLAGSHDAGPQVAFNMLVLRILRALLAVSQTLGDLALIQDETEFLTVNVAGAAAPDTPVAVSYTGAGFTPVAGDYVLFASPAHLTGNGHGFVTKVFAPSGSNFNAVLSEVVDATWRIYLVSIHFPNTQWVKPEEWNTQDQATDKVSDNLPYVFRSASDPIWAAAYETALAAMMATF